LRASLLTPNNSISLKGLQARVAATMRLLDTSTLELSEFYTPNVPPYAILSHTWNVEEVTFQEQFSPRKTAKKGWAKIAKTCELARSSGLAYAWVDTCCIDKSSSAELSEAINSMYQWYLEVGPLPRKVISLCASLWGVSCLDIFSCSRVK
jgi:hypothetical protein